MNPERITFSDCIKPVCGRSFPDCNEGSRYNRSIGDLWSVILAVRISLQVVLDALALEETAVIASAPVPCMGDMRAKDGSRLCGHG